MKGVNKPFVVLLALGVGMGAGTYIVAAGPPIRVVSTYRVVSDWQRVQEPIYNYTLAAWVFQGTVVVAKCNPGDSATGGGYEFRSAPWNSSSGFPVNYDPAIVPVSQPWADNTTGTEGWTVAANFIWGSSTTPDTDVRAFAVCLHRM